MLFRLLDVLGCGLHKLSRVCSFYCFIQCSSDGVSIRNIDPFRYLPCHIRHDIVRQFKILVHKQIMNILWILIPTIALKVPDHPVINTINHDLDMLLIKLELGRGYPLYSWLPLRHWFHCISLTRLP